MASQSTGVLPVIDETKEMTRRQVLYMNCGCAIVFHGSKRISPTRLVDAFGLLIPNVCLAITNKAAAEESVFASV